MSLTYQDLVQTGFPLAYFAKALGLSDVSHWKERGIPSVHLPKLSNVLATVQRKIAKSLENPAHPRKVKPVDSTADLFATEFVQDYNIDSDYIPECPPDLLAHFDAINAADVGVSDYAFSSCENNNLAHDMSANVGKNLGKLPNNPAESEQPNNINDLAWLNIPPLSDEENAKQEARFQRFKRQNVARYLQKGERVEKCLRKSTALEIQVKRFNDGRSYFSDLDVCGSVWRCPVCAAKISEKRRAEGVLATTTHRKMFGDDACLFFTFTYSHHREDVLPELVAKQAAAMAWMKDEREYISLMNELGYVGDIRSLEITYGHDNGWHPHVHTIFFFDKSYGESVNEHGRTLSQRQVLDNIKRGFFPLWKAACAKFGLGEPSWEHGLDIQGGAFAAEYMLKFGLEDERVEKIKTNHKGLKKVVETDDGFEMTFRKWGMEDEIFKSHVKKGKKGSLTPFQLLDVYADGDKSAGKLFQDYAEAFAGSRQSRWSKGLKFRFRLISILNQYFSKNPLAVAFIDNIKRLSLEMLPSKRFLKKYYSGSQPLLSFSGLLDYWLELYRLQDYKCVGLLVGYIYDLINRRTPEAQTLRDDMNKSVPELKDASDKEAAYGEDLGYLFALIPRADWKVIEKKSRGRSDVRSILLYLSDIGDVQRFWAYVDWICERDVSLRVFAPVVSEIDPVSSELDPQQLQILDDLPQVVAASAQPPIENPEIELDFTQHNQSTLLDFDPNRRVKPTINQAPEQILKAFGYDDFRGVQRDVIRHVINGGSGLVLMPTGGGKSLCYQIPMLARKGMGVVISPLIALMHDQVKALVDKGIRAVYLNSQLTPRRIRDTEQRILNGEVDILYISPERLNLSKTIKFLSACEISCFAVDEAHCISQWGHDFRSDYLAVDCIKKYFPHVPRLALTATANSDTRADIVKLLGLETAPKFVTSFDRPNIEYNVLYSASGKDSIALLLDYCTKNNHQTGIVYTSSRVKCEDLAELLRQQGVNALAYHAGMTSKQRRESLEIWLNSSAVMVATTAFGMGIDKADVRFVLHFDLSDSIEAFYQESGRAGRDGLPSESVVIYNERSTNSRVRHMTDDKLLAFEQIRRFCELPKENRRQYLLDFFV